MKKRAFIIHGFEGSPDESWFGWLKRKLEENRFTVEVPAMPRPRKPNVYEWVSRIRKVVDVPDKQCYFIGHSLGCITILRYLESLEKTERVGGAVFVAGFAENIGLKDIRGFFQKDIEWSEIRKHCKKFVAINSNNDEYVAEDSGKIFGEKLGAEVVVINNMGHFTIEDGITSLHPVLDAVLRISD